MSEKRLRAVVALAAAIALLPSSLLATTLLRLGTQDLADISPIVVTGEVLEQQTRLYEDGVFPVTYTTVVVDQTFKGTTAPVIDIFTLGGRVDDLIGEPPGVAEFEPGEKVLLFLTEKFDKGEDTYDVYGWFQGKWSVVADPGGVEYLVNDHAEKLADTPANELIPADELGRFEFQAFVQALQARIDQN